MKKIISVLLIATFLLSTAVYAKEDVKKEFGLEFLVQVGQQYIDGFYRSDEQINNEEYIVTDINLPVYSIDKDIMAYILEVQNKNGDEIGYVMVGSNETSPVILEASIDEGLISYLMNEGKNNKVIYIAPLKLAFNNKGTAKNEKQYIDVRTKETFNYEFVESKSKISKEEMQEKNKKNWEMIEEIIPSYSTGAEQVNILATTYAYPTVYQVNDEANFVRIPDLNDPSVDDHYGGNQNWFENPYTKSNSCGPVAAANIAAYKAAQAPTGSWGNLYNGSGKFTGVYDQNNFIEHMETLYDYITPGLLGVMSTDDFDSGMRDFMQDCGVYSITSNEVNASRYDVFVDGVTEGLSHECPIALLFWDADNGGMDDPDFEFHWITMTKYYKDNNTQIEYFACSSWGERYSLPLYDYWWSYWIEGGVYYW